MCTAEISVTSRRDRGLEPAAPAAAAAASVFIVQYEDRPDLCPDLINSEAERSVSGLQTPRSRLAQ